MSLFVEMKKKKLVPSLASCQEVLHESFEGLLVKLDFSISFSLNFSLTTPSLIVANYIINCIFDLSLDNFPQLASGSCIKINSTYGIKSIIEESNE